MIEPDTIKLLRECDAGIKMGVASIDEVLEAVHDQEFREALRECRTGHEKLGEEIQSLLEQAHDDGKEPNPMAKGMSWMKTNMKMSLNPGDDTIADLISTGCDMGVRTLCRYLNRCKDASEQARSLVKRVIKVEEELSVELRTFL